MKCSNIIHNGYTVTVDDAKGDNACWDDGDK